MEKSGVSHSLISTTPRGLSCSHIQRQISSVVGTSKRSSRFEWSSFDITRFFNFFSRSRKSRTMPSRCNVPEKAASTFHLWPCSLSHIPSGDCMLWAASKCALTVTRNFSFSMRLTPVGGWRIAHGNQESECRIRKDYVISSQTGFSRILKTVKRVWFTVTPEFDTLVSDSERAFLLYLHHCIAARSDPCSFSVVQKEAPIFYACDGGDLIVNRFFALQARR